jgi:hypothetical protein
MDPVPLEHLAKVTVSDNRVCITVPASEGEKIASAQFGSDTGQEVYKTFSGADEQIPAVRGECLPAFGFEFKPSNTYAVFYRLEKSSTEPGRVFAARFSLEQDRSGILRLIEKP